MECKVCGTPVTETQKFCLECGTKDPGKSSYPLCPSCHTEITNKNAKFCPECGHKLPRKCKCGADIEPKAKFCSECGDKVGESPGTPSSRPAQDKPEGEREVAVHQRVEEKGVENGGGTEQKRKERESLKREEKQGNVGCVKSEVEKQERKHEEESEARDKTEESKEEKAGEKEEKDTEGKETSKERVSREGEDKDGEGEDKGKEGEDKHQEGEDKHQEGEDNLKEGGDKEKEGEGKEKKREDKEKEGEDKEKEEEGKEKKREHKEKEGEDKEKGRESNKKEGEGQEKKREDKEKEGEDKEKEVEKKEKEREDKEKEGEDKEKEREDKEKEGEDKEKEGEGKEKEGEDKENEEDTGERGEYNRKETENDTREKKQKRDKHAEAGNVSQREVQNYQKNAEDGKVCERVGGTKSEDNIAAKTIEQTPSVSESNTNPSTNETPDTAESLSRGQHTRPAGSLAEETQKRRKEDTSDLNARSSRQHDRTSIVEEKKLPPVPENKHPLQAADPSAEAAKQTSEQSTESGEEDEKNGQDDSLERLPERRQTRSSRGNREAETPTEPENPERVVEEVQHKYKTFAVTGQPREASGARSVASQRTSARSKTSQVVFHLVVPACDRQIQKVVIKLPHPEKDQAMRYTGYSNENGHLFEGSVQWTNRRENGYKYVVYVYNKKKNEKTVEENKTRPAPQQGRVAAHVYDIFQAPPRAFKSYLPGSSTPVAFTMSDSSEGVSLFLPTPETVVGALSGVENQLEKAEDILEDVRVIQKCLASVTASAYYVTTEYPYAKPFQESVEKYLLTPLLDSVSETRDEVATVLAVFVLVLAHTVEIKIEQIKKRLLFKALLIKPDLKDNVCLEVTNLRQHFQSYFDGAKEKDLRQILLNSLLTDFEGSGGSDPSWLYCVPLLHFLYNESQPFKALVLDENHRTERWWGVRCCKTLIHEFKVASAKARWRIMEEEVYDQLTDAFKADPLMMRTFVAAMNLKSVLHIFSKRKFPVEIIIAALHYHYLEQQRKLETGAEDVLWKCAENVRAEKHTSARDAECLKCLTSMTLNFLRDLVTSNSPVTRPAMHLCLALLDSLVIAEQNLRTQPKTDSCRKEIIQLLKFWANTTDSPDKFKAIEECLLLCKSIVDPDLRMAIEDAMFGVFLQVAKKFSLQNQIQTYFRLMEQPDAFTESTKNKLIWNLDAALSVRLSESVRLDSPVLWVLQPDGIPPPPPPPVLLESIGTIALS